MSKNFDPNNWQGRLRNWQNNFNAGFSGRRGPTAKPGEEPAPNQRRGAQEWVEEIKVSGQNLVGEVSRLLRETEVTRLRIRQGNQILLDIPVTWVAVGAIIAPALAAVGAIAAVVTNCTIEVTRTGDRPSTGGFGNVRPATPSASASKPTEGSPASKESGPSSPDDLSYR